MKRFKLSRSWRPSGWTLTWCLIACYMVNTVGNLAAVLLGVADASIMYPATTAVSKFVLVLDILILLDAIAVIAGLSWNTSYAATETHPLLTREFWTGALAFALSAFIVTSLLRVIGLWTLPMSFGTVRGERATGSLTVTLMVGFALARLRGKPSVLGIGFGLSAFLIFSLCTL